MFEVCQKKVSSFSSRSAETGRVVAVCSLAQHFSLPEAPELKRKLPGSNDSSGWT